MTTISPAADLEITRLLEENRYLSQDLKQLQADKDFVWSLWKKLQVSNPDVTQAIGLVVQREKEKAEIRDRKVLEVLQQKDEKIQELQANLSYKTRELGESTVRHSDVNDEIIRLQREVTTLQDRNSTLELQLKKKSTSSKKSDGLSETPVTKSSRQRSAFSPTRAVSKADKSTSVKPKKVRNIEGREKNLENAHSDTILGYEQEKRELSQKLHKVTLDLEKARSEKADEMASRVQVESKVRTLEREIEQKLGKFEQLVQELEEARNLLRRFESQARQQQQDLDYKNNELETVRKELAELWSTHNQLTEHSSQQADLIRQIQSLQTDTQKMMKNQEEAYSLESNSIQQMYTELTARYDTAKQAESELRSQVLALKKDLLDKDDVISEMQHKMDKHKRRNIDNSGSFIEDDKVGPVLDMKYKVKSMQREIDNLRRQLVERESRIEHLEEDAINQTIEFDVARLNRHERTHSTPSRQFRSIGLSPMKGQEEKIDRGHRSRSMSPCKDRQRPRYHIQKDLEDCRAILKLKIRELNELKKAHQKRQERLKTVQDNYKNVKEQLKTLEAEYYGTKKKTKKVKRADPKELRHEDSAAVWNELAYFKNENRNMAVERMSIEEELDNLRVQSSEDAATIHELKVTLQQEREERMYDKKKVERNMEGVATQKSEIVLLKSEVQNKDVIIQRLERDMSDVRCDRDTILEEKKVLKQEILELKQESSQHRMDQADLRRNINRLKRELEEEKSISKLNANKAAAALQKSAKTTKIHKRRNRNNFNISASRKFNELIEDGWEELSEEDTDIENDGEIEALERANIKKSRQGTGQDTTEAGQEPVGYKIRRSVPMKPTSKTRQKSQEFQPPARHTEARANRALIFRDTATSPITSPVIEATVSKKSPAQSSAIRQLRPMKQRVNYLQQQVVTLRDSRATALKTIDELKETNTQLQSDLNLANQRLRLSKQSVQKLNNDIDKLTQDKKEIENKLTQKLEMGGSTESGRTEHEWKVLEGRLKSCSNELSRQNNVVRQLKQENEQLTDQTKLLQDKVTRAERDSSQKRTLLEDQRNRVKQALESAKNDADSLEQLETRMKLLQDTNEKLKIQIDSYKKRLGVVTREKRDYEERFLKLTTELEKKNKVILDNHMRKQELESSLTDMEKLATQQMKSLARESEDALETAKDKVKEIQDILQSYQRFVKNLAQEIVRRTQQVRYTLKDQEYKKAATEKSNVSLQKAQNLAKDILNLSQSDLDEIMSADGEQSKMESELEMDRRHDKKWVKKIDRTQNCKDDFAMSLMDLFLHKIEERVDLSVRLQQSSTRIETSLQS